MAHRDYADDSSRHEPLLLSTQPPPHSSQDEDSDGLEVPMALLEASFNVDEELIYALTNVEEDGVTDRSDQRYDISRSRWSFLSRAFEDWFSTAAFENHCSCSLGCGMHFDCFTVHLPFTTARSPASDAYLQRLRDASELVGLMLRVDVSAWQFVKKAGTRAFRYFRFPDYDPQILEPKMKFVLHQRWGNEPDQPAAIQRLRFMLLECDRQVNSQALGGEQFLQDKTRILELDTKSKLRGWRIPIALQLTPREPQQTEGVAALREYLQEAIALIRDLLAKTDDKASYFAFQLVEAGLTLFMTHAREVIADLHELIALGVSVKMDLRHSTRSWYPVQWSGFSDHDNLYPLLAHAVETSTASVSFSQQTIVSSVELLSAVASASTLRELTLGFVNPQGNLSRAQAEWLAYALRHNHGLQSLILRDFIVTEDTFHAMEAIVKATNPASVLPRGEHHHTTSSEDEPPQLLTLMPGALVKTAGTSEACTLAQLGVGVHTEFAVVSTSISPDRIEFVVPGYGIGSAAEADVVSIRPMSEPHDPLVPSGLTALALYNLHCCPSSVSRFVRLFGHSLQHLSCSMLGEDSQQELVSIFASCPQLTSLCVERSSFSSLEPLVQHFESRDCQLRSLEFFNVSIAAPALLQLFAALSDPTATISRKLEDLYVDTSPRLLDAEDADAALLMLKTNRRLVRLVLRVQASVVDTHKLKFDEEEASRTVSFSAEQVALGLLSVQQHRQDEPLGRLDWSCIELICAFAGESVSPRIQVVGPLY